LSRFRTRSDANQKEIDIALRAVGASVIPLGNVGRGCPDRLVGYKGETFLIETKNKNAHARRVGDKANHLRTEAQMEFHASWQGRPIVIVYSIEEALETIGAKN